MQIGPVKISLMERPEPAGTAVATPEDGPENAGGSLHVPGQSRGGSFLHFPRRFQSREQHGLVDLGLGGHPLDLGSELYLSLSEDLQEQSRAHPHIWEYLSELPMDEIGIPHYNSRLTKEMVDPENRNIIYPVSEGIFIHIYPDQRDSRDFYIAIEPSIGPTVPVLIDQVDRRLINFIEDLKASQNSEDRASVLLSCLERICSVKGGLRNRKAIKVTQAELEGLRYLMIRDKEGLGAIEPLILDPYIEDISCSGVGPLFVEHKIFGGLKSGISFDTEAELDRFVIKMSEKIGRPVTVREPIVDAVLPDGSRVNIVYGGDVSKRGSNFTIRKFKTTPMSIIDLIDGGTLSYEMAAYLSLMIGTGMNTFVSGETASGKTTLLNAVTTLIPPNHKIVSIEDTAELQVPHPNWTREVVRGNVGGGSSVSMFDLLRAAMRQRPNEIIIGEIRGEEGAVAFQAMQTGHACMATFHASSVEKLIQRLTGNPINIPKTYIDSLNLIIIMSAVRLPDGSTGRRVMRINEIVSYDSETNLFNFIEVFRWNAALDRFEFPGFNNAYLLENVAAVQRGLPPKKTRRIYEEIDARAVILRKLHERGVNNFYELHGILSQAYRQGLFR